MQHNSVVPARPLDLSMLNITTLSYKCTASQHKISIIFYRTTYYRGCRNGAKGAGGGSLESVDCKLARGSPTACAAKMLVGDPEPTPQRQKLPLPMRQSPGARWVRDSGGWKNLKTGDRCAGLVTVGESGDRWMRKKVEREKEGGNRPNPEKLSLLKYPCRSANPLLRHLGPGCHACTGHTSPQSSWNIKHVT